MQSEGVMDAVNLNIVRATKENDNRLITPVDCLENAAREIKNGERKCNKVLVITLDDSGENNFSVGFYAANINSSEMLAALEVMKAQTLQTMGYIPE